MQSILVIGAGLAGLAVARRLAAAGSHVTILEARDRIGGRVHTLHDPRFAIPVELGAEFVHGKPPELWEFIRREDLMAGSLEGDNWCYQNRALTKCNDFWTRWTKVAGALKRGKTYPDRSFLDFIQTTDFDTETVQAAMEFVEGFNAAPADEISMQFLASVQEMSDRVSGDTPFRIFRGLDAIVHSLSRFDSQTVDLHLNTPVSGIRWRLGRVQAGEFEADAAVVTVPLGVLQSGAVSFIPHLSEKTAAANRLAMGHVVKVVLGFHSSFWDERGMVNLSFLHARGQKFPTWWTTRPIATAILVGWSAGPAAERLVGQSTDFVLHAAIESLSTALKIDARSVERRLKAFVVADWRSEPFSLGAYSYVPVDAITASVALAEPVANTLFFAGEATNSDGNAGTMHGAIASGYRAADELLKSFHIRAA